MGRKQKKKIHPDLSMKETAVFSNHSVPARNLRKTDLGAVIFGATHHTINECLSRQLFGLPDGHFSYIKNIKEGLVLFLFNYSDRKLHGVFEAASHGQMNIDQYAWVDDEDDTGYTRYPAQVKIRVRNLFDPLPEDKFQPIIAQNYYEINHFYFELDMDQTNKLVSLFASSSTKGSISKKWNTLYASLPTSTRRQEDNVHVLQGVTNLHQTSKVSYASALAGTSNTATTTSSSQPVGKWSALFKSESGFENSTNRYDLLSNEEHEEYEDKDDDLLEADTWEDSHWAVGNEAECDQTWTSDVNLQENNVTNDADAMVGNTWEEADVVVESHWAVGNEAECDQTWASDVNHQANSVTNNADAMVENTWEEADVMEGNTWEESQGGVTDEVECAEIRGSDLNLEANIVTSKADDENDANLVPNRVENETDLQSLVSKLMQEFEEMKGSHLKLIVKNNRLEQELDASKQEIQQLKTRVSDLESGPRSNVNLPKAQNLLPRYTDSVFIVGGHDGSSWLPTVDSYFPSHDIKISLSSMNFVRIYASAATLSGEIYHFGGDTVESFNPTSNKWIPRPPLYWKNINVAGASLKDRLYVVGGAIGTHCSAEVEYLDMNLGKWLPARSMQSKRLAPAAAELNNVMYVSGGYDGVSYTSSVERYDPREQNWCKVPNMNARKGCHSMVVLNEKLYTVGGFGGDRDLATVEYLDTRMGAWVEAEPMNVSRGNFGTFLLEGMLYAVGGRKEDDEVLDIVECYKEGGGWEFAPNLKAIGKRSHFSAFVM